MSIECLKFRTHLSEYIDGQAPAGMHWKIRMHLTVCQECAAVAQSLRDTTDLLKVVARVEVSDSFDSKLQAKLAPIIANPPAKIGVATRLAAAVTDSTAVSRMPRRAFAFAFAGAAVAAGLVAVVNLQPVNTAALAHNYAAAHHSRRTVVPAGEMAFVAACSREHAQYQSAQPIADPAAQTLAERVDANGAAGSIGAQGVDDND